MELFPVPSYHEYRAYRLDLSAIADAAQAHALLSRVESITEESDGGDEWLTTQLHELSDGAPELVLDLLVFERDFTAWTLWSLVGEDLTKHAVQFRPAGESRTIRLSDEWMSPEISTPSDDAAKRAEAELLRLLPSPAELVLGDGRLQFPFEWTSKASLLEGLDILRPYFGHVPKLALVEIAESGRAGGLHLVRLSDLPRPTDLTRLEPWIEDPTGRSQLERLWFHGSEVVHRDSP